MAVLLPVVRSTADILTSQLTIWASGGPLTEGGAGPMQPLCKVGQGTGSLAMPSSGSLRSRFPESAVLGKKSVPETHPTAR